MATNQVYMPPAGGRLEISDDGGTTYHRVLALTDFSSSGGAREETTTTVLDDDVDPVVSVGPAQPKDLSITVNANPGMPGYQILYAGYTDKKRVTMRYSTTAERIEENATAAVTLALAATGVVTGVQTKFLSDVKWQRGRGVKLGANLFVIDTITTETSMTVVRADGAAVAQAAASDDWELWDFGLRWTVEAEVRNAGNLSFATGQPMQDSVEIKTLGTWPKPTFLFANP